MTAKSHIMEKKVTHDTEMILKCQQEKPIKSINDRLDTMDRRIEKWSMV